MVGQDCLEVHFVEGHLTLGPTRFVIKKGDITKEHVEAIVNAANSSLLGGGGVDGAIHRAGGPAILAACQAIRQRQGGCPTGGAVITTGGNLPARYVIHTVGPVWQGGDTNEDEVRREDRLLEEAYWNSLSLTSPHGIATIAFPSISTGIYRFPIQRACWIALQTAKRYVIANDHLREIRFVLFSDNDLCVYEKALYSQLGT